MNDAQQAFEELRAAASDSESLTESQQARVLVRRKAKTRYYGPASNRKGRATTPRAFPSRTEAASRT